MSNNPNVWATKDGRKIPVRQMSDKHLINTIRYLLRTAAVRLQIMQEASPMDFQGEMAQECADQEYNMLQDMCVEDYLQIHCPQWDTLLKQAEKRGLELNIPDEYAEDF